MYKCSVQPFSDQFKEVYSFYIYILAQLKSFEYNRNFIRYHVVPVKSPLVKRVTHFPLGDQHLQLLNSQN